MTEAEMIRNLNSFTKTQIINAIVKTYPYKGMVERLISNLEYLERDEVLQKHKDAIEEESRATQEYIQWKRDMIQKYGTDGKVRLIDIPNDELRKDADLESKMKASREKERRLSEKVDSLFGL